MHITAEIFLMSVVEYFGDSSLKKYSREGSKWSLAVGIFMYILIVIFIIFALKRTNVMFMNGMWDAMSIVLETTLAYILLQETMTNKIQYVGLIFIVIGILIMNYGVPPK